mmetsp:Transcript_8320/g.10814  ORF Transcript_8320/g.10814 Transcript_8320/m.10814 type:complete len:84 (+) Transcript_8320:222-473(+)
MSRSEKPSAFCGQRKVFRRKCSYKKNISRGCSSPVASLVDELLDEYFNLTPLVPMTTLFHFDWEDIEIMHLDTLPGNTKPCDS